MLEKRYGTQKCPGRKVGKSSSKPMFCGFHPSFGEISVFFSFDRICFLGPTSFRGTYLGAHEEQRPPQHPNGVPWEGTTAAPTAALGPVLLEAAAAWRTRRISKGLHNYVYMCVCDLWYSVECCGVVRSLHVHSLLQPATLLFWSWHASCL